MSLLGKFNTLTLLSEEILALM